MTIRMTQNPLMLQAKMSALHPLPQGNGSQSTPSFLQPLKADSVQFGAKRKAPPTDSSDSETESDSEFSTASSSPAPFAEDSIEALFAKSSIRKALEKDELLHQEMNSAFSRLYNTMETAFEPLLQSPEAAKLKLTSKATPVEKVKAEHQLSTRLKTRVDQAIEKHKAAYDKAVRTLMGKQSISQLNPAGQYQRARLEYAHHAQLSILEQLQETRLSVFRQLLAKRHAPAVHFDEAMDTDEETVPAGLTLAHPSKAGLQGEVQLILQDPAFEAAHAAFTENFEMGLTEAIQDTMKSPGWLASAQKPAAANAQEKSKLLNAALNEYVQATLKALAKDIEARSIALLGKRPTKAAINLQALPPAKRQAILRMQLEMKQRQAFIEQFDMQAFVNTATATGADDEKPGKTGKTPAFRRAMLELAKQSDPALKVAIERARTGASEDIRLAAFKQLLSSLPTSRQPQKDHLLKALLVAVRELPMGVPSEAVAEDDDSTDGVKGVIALKMQAVGVILKTGDNKEKARTLTSWLNSGRMENQLAVLQLFSFSNVGKAMTAHHLLETVPLFRQAVEAVRENAPPSVEPLFTLIDQFIAERNQISPRAIRGNYFSVPSLIS